MISDAHASTASSQFCSEPSVGGDHCAVNPPDTVPPTGSTRDARTVAALPDARSDLLQLPPEIKLVMFNQLSYRDIVALSQTCKMLYTLIDEKMLVYSAYFKQHLTPACQENFRVAANLLTQQEIETYIRQFSDDPQFITHCLSLRGNQLLFPEFLFFHMQQIKTKCRYLEVKTMQNIEYRGQVVTHGIFSPNGRHMLTMNLISGEIHSLNGKGQWEVKTAIQRNGLALSKAIFSPDSRHVVITCRPLFRGQDRCGSKVEIYSLGNDEEWRHAITIPDYGRPIGLLNELPAIFFNKSQNILFIRNNNNETGLTTYGLDNSGNWLSNPVNNQLCRVDRISHSPDGLHGVALQYKYQPNCYEMCPSFIEFFAISGHNWLPQYTFACDFVYKLSFSPDSQHLMLVSNKKTEIYGINSNGQWNPKKTINHNDDDYDHDRDSDFYRNHPEFCRTTFSPNGQYLAAFPKGFCSAEIYGLTSGKRWYRITTTTHDRAIRMVSFSPDSHHLVTVSGDCYAKIYSLEVSGHCSLEKTIIHDSAVNHADFSPDSSHLVTGCSSGQIKIYGMLTNRQWVEKGSTGRINSETDNNGVFSVRFSPCGFRILASCENGEATLYTLCDAQLNKSPGT